MTNDDLLIPMIEKINALERRLAEMESRERAIGDMLKSVYDANNNGIVDAAEAAPWSGITDKPDIETVSGEIVIGQDTEIDGDLTVSGAIHGSGLIVGFDPPKIINDGPSITAGTHNIYLPDYGISGYSWVFVIVGGRTSPAGPYMHVRKYGTTVWYVALDNSSSTDNNYAGGWCPVVSNRIALYASASFEIAYLRITAAMI